MASVLNRYAIKRLLREQDRLGRFLTRDDFNLFCSQAYKIDRESSKELLRELRNEGFIEGSTKEKLRIKDASIR